MNMMDTTTSSYYPRAAATAMSSWQSCFAAAFTTSPPLPIAIIRPPPMTTSHYYYNMLQSPRKASPSATFLPSLLEVPATAFSFRTPTSLFGITSNSLSSTARNSSSRTTSTSSNEEDKNPTHQKQPRIAIIGGGIAGVTAANALGKKFASTSNSDNDNDKLSAKIVVFEGDCEGGHRRVNFGKFEQPTWIAATARNANSLVPGAAMHVMSQRKTLLKIAKDMVREWYSEQVESFQHWLHDKGHIDYQITKSIDNFDVIPPYFALHLFRCIGPSATSDERATFVTFLKQFLLTSLLSGEIEANERGRYIQQLAKSNRFSFLEALNGGDDTLAKKIGVGKGFLSLHRTSQDAIHAYDEGQLFGETSLIMPLEEAAKLEPRISNIPIKNQLFVVQRVDDYTANSAVFVQDLVDKIKGRGVEYRCGEIGMIQDISQIMRHEHETKSVDSASKVLATAPTMKRQTGFKITTKDGFAHEFDYVVLAAGVNTPLFARKLSVGESCPTYPLRGYSLTIYTNHTQDKDANGQLENRKSANLLNMPLSIDDMYCSSVGVNMARMAGFGELVGYRDKAADVSSLAPRVMARYARAIFPESSVTEETALQCFRPCSPDDIPIVGEVSSVPGLYMHTGHGTLGWTLCLATSECLAQAVHDDINCNETPSMYQLPGGITVDRALLSPDRFL